LCEVTNISAVFMKRTSLQSM